MSSLATVALVIVLLVVGTLVVWLYRRSRRARDESEPDGQSATNRSDSTLGELRDLREALGPLAGAAGTPAKRTSPVRVPDRVSRQTERNAR